MTVFLCVLCLICGFGAKLGFDEYHKWQNRQKETYEKMEDIYIKMKALEQMKKVSEFPDTN